MASHKPAECSETPEIRKQVDPVAMDDTVLRVFTDWLIGDRLVKVNLNTHQQTL